METIATASTNISYWLKCIESHHLYTREGGTGIIPKTSNEHLIFGLAVHDPAEALMLHPLVNTQDLIDTLKAQLEPLKDASIDGTPRSTEYYWLGAGLIYAFREFVLPKIRKLYRVQAVEQEMMIPLGIYADKNIEYCTRPDVILERVEDGKFFNNNIKTSGYVKDLGLIYEFSLQMLLEAEAVRREYDCDISGSIITAFNKGKKGAPTKSDKDRGFITGRRIDSPFTYVWWKKGKWSFRWSKDAAKVGVWEFCKDPAEWYDQLKEVCGSEFVSGEVDISEPIRHSTSMDLKKVTDSVCQMVTSDLRVRNYDACNNYGGYNKPCQYKMWCWGTDQERVENYEPRIPNHPLELKLSEEDF